MRTVFRKKRLHFLLDILILLLVWDNMWLLFPYHSTGPMLESFKIEVEGRADFWKTIEFVTLVYITQWENIGGPLWPLTPPAKASPACLSLITQSGGRGRCWFCKIFSKLLEAIKCGNVLWANMAICGFFPGDQFPVLLLLFVLKPTTLVDWPNLAAATATAAVSCFLEPNLSCHKNNGTIICWRSSILVFKILQKIPTKMLSEVIVVV